MTKTFDEVISGIRSAIYGREVREDIAQMGEYLKTFKDDSAASATAAANSASAAASSASQSSAYAGQSATYATQASKSAEQAAGSVTQASQIVEAGKKACDQKISAAQGYVNNASDYASQAAASATAAKNCTGGYYADYSLTIPVSAWGYNTMASSTFAYEAKISVADCTSDMIPLGSIELGSYETARAAGMACMCYADNNCMRFFAQEKPTAEIKMQVSILAHMANISAYLDIDRATDAEINELIETYFGKEG